MGERIKLVFSGDEFKNADVPDASFVALGERDNDLNKEYYQRIYHNKSSKYVFWTENRIGEVTDQ